MNRLKAFFSLIMILLLVILGGDSTASGHIQGADIFYDTNQSLGNSISQAVATADLNGDGSPDVFVGNNGANKVYLNNSFGQFTATIQNLGDLNTEGVALADLDGDDDIDAVATNSNGPNQIWLNNGSGSFSAGQTLTSDTSRGVALGPLDGDTDIDVFIANDGGNTVWFNDGNANFTDSGQSLGTATSYDVELGYLSGDTFIDAFVANGNTTSDPDAVWFNDGMGNFSPNGQTLASVWSYDVALGDLNYDTFVDAFTASWFPNANRVWFNVGGGLFVDGGQLLGTAASIGVDLGDVDDDSDLDAVVGNNVPGPNRLWVNDGSGQFNAGQGMDTGTTTYAIALEDFDGDSDPDAFFANFGPNQVWNNGEPGTPDAYFAVDRESTPKGDYVYYRGQTGNALVPVMLSQPAPQNMNVQARIEAPGGVTTQTIPFNTDDQVQMLNLVNPDPNPDVEFKLSLFVPMIGPPTDSLTFVWIAGDQGPSDCILCYLDWLLRFLNFQPTFYEMHSYNLPDQQNSPQWNYYTRLFDSYSPALSTMVGENPTLAWKSHTTLQQWTPAVESLSNDTGDMFVVTGYMADNLNNLFDSVKEEADPGLAAIVQREQDLLDIESLAGLNMNEVWEELQIRRPVEELYITIILKGD